MRCSPVRPSLLFFLLVMAVSLHLIMPVGAVTQATNYYVLPASINCGTDAYVSADIVDSTNVEACVSGNCVALQKNTGTTFDAIIPFKFFAQGTENIVVLKAHGSPEVLLTKKVGVNTCPGVSLSPQEWITGPITQPPKTQEQTNQPDSWHLVGIIVFVLGILIFIVSTTWLLMESRHRKKGGGLV